MSDTPVTVHWNKDTQGAGDFRRRDIVVLKNPQLDRIDIEWYRKRIGQKGEVSAVFDNSKTCLVLFEDGYWLSLHFDEIENTGEKGHGFPEVYVVPCHIWN
jgi:hypothetical protein